MMDDEEEEEEGEERREGVGEDGDMDEGMRQEREEMEQVDEGEGEREDEEGNVDEEEVLLNKQLMSADIVKSKQKARTKSISSVNSKHTGILFSYCTCERTYTCTSMCMISSNIQPTLCT